MSRLRLYKTLTGLEDERVQQERGAILKIDKKNQFFDRTEGVPGTRPEKIVYNTLVGLRINFEFQYHYPENWDTSNQEGMWIPDFQLQDYNNSLIEVYGTYWHTHIRSDDQLKKAYWLADGYTVYEHGIPLMPSGKNNGSKVVIWWEFEIYQGIDFLFSRDLPEIFQKHIKGAAAEETRDVQKEILRLRTMRATIAKRQRKPGFKGPKAKVEMLRNKIYNRTDYEVLMAAKKKKVFKKT